MLHYKIICSNWNDSHLTDTPYWASSLSLNHEKDWRVCAKWSLAAEKAAEVSAKLTEASYKLHSSTRMTEDVLSWLPELLLQGYSPAQDLLRYRLTLIFPPDFDPNTMSVDSITRLAFCDAYRLTIENQGRISDPSRRLARTSRLSKSQRKQLANFYSIAEAAYKRLCPTVSLEVLPLEQYPEIMAGTSLTQVSFLGQMVLATFFAGGIYQLLTYALNHDEVRRTWPGGRSNIRPPRGDTISFDKLFSIGQPPFTTIKGEDPRSTFLARHLPIMTSPEFLSDGEWVGYYCYIHRTNEPPIWDAMMHSIHFEITADYADHCAVTTRGEDGCGSFSLLGTCHKRSGRIQMTKQYDDGTTWVWSGIMTPFGIVCSWGRNAGSNRSRLIWLWKGPWTAQSDF